MGLLDRLFRRKASEARQVCVVNQVGKPNATPVNYENFSREAYQANVIAFKCISLIGKSAGAIDWDLFQKRNGADPIEIEDHPILDLLKRPNPMQAQSAFFESVVSYLQLAGNTYVEGVSALDRIDAQPEELWPIKPEKMQVIPGANGNPAGYRMESQGRQKVWESDPINGDSKILHVKYFHPVDLWYGMSPLEAAMYPIDQHNESGKWNLSILQKSGVPSGVMKIMPSATNPSGVLPEMQYDNLKMQIEQNFSGGQNAGRPMLLEGGVEWEQLGVNPKDMDFLNGKNSAARDISLALGVPPLLLNIANDNTFANFKEARVSFYEDTVLPLMDLLESELNRWLVPRYGDNLKLKYDLDSIDALSVKRESKFTSVGNADFLTINEKRDALGFEPIDGGDVLLVPGTLSTLGSVDEDEEEVPEDDVESTEEQDNASDSDQGQAQEEQPEVETASYKLGYSPEYDLHCPVKEHTCEGKQLNPLNQNERNAVWADLNRKRDRHSEALALELEEIFRKEAEQLEKTVNEVARQGSNTIEIAALQVLDESSSKMEQVIAKFIRRGIISFTEDLIREASAQVGFETKNRNRFLTFVDEFVARRAEKAAELARSTSEKKTRRKIGRFVREALSEGQSEAQLAKNIRDDLEGISASRAQVIARTEIAVATNSGSLQAAKELQIPGMTKEWVSVQDSRTRTLGNNDNAEHLQMNGAKVPLDEKFSVPSKDGPDDMDGPGDSSAPADQVINCRCVLVFNTGA